MKICSYLTSHQTQHEPKTCQPDSYTDGCRKHVRTEGIEEENSYICRVFASAEVLIFLTQYFKEKKVLPVLNCRGVEMWLNSRGDTGLFHFLCFLLFKLSCFPFQSQQCSPPCWWTSHGSDMRNFSLPRPGATMVPVPVCRSAFFFPLLPLLSFSLSLSLKQTNTHYFSETS